MGELYDVANFAFLAAQVLQPPAWPFCRPWGQMLLPSWSSQFALRFVPPLHSQKADALGSHSLHLDFSLPRERHGTCRRSVPSSGAGEQW
jgi:hypothetical protein